MTDAVRVRVGDVVVRPTGAIREAGADRPLAFLAVLGLLLLGLLLTQPFAAV